MKPNKTLLARKSNLQYQKNSSHKELDPIQKSSMSKLSNLQKLKLAKNANILGLSGNAQRTNQMRQQPAGSQGSSYTRLFSPQTVSSQANLAKPAHNMTVNLRGSTKNVGRDALSPVQADSRQRGGLAVNQRLYASTI